MKNWKQLEGDLTQKDVGEIIKIVREEHVKLSQEHTAENIGVKLITLQQAERGKGNNGFNVLSRICDKYNLKAQLIVKT